MFEHKSGLPRAYDRHPDKPNHASVVFREETFIEGADLNEAQSIVRSRQKRLGNLVNHDGDRISGCDAIVDVNASEVTITAGRVYVAGDVHAVDGAVLAAVPMTGDVTVGVRITETFPDEVADPDLKGIFPGEESEGEPCAARETITLSWGFEGDGVVGALFPVYLIRDSTVIDQTQPAILGGVNQAISAYIVGSHGNYISEGCRVTALGKIATAQHFSIQAGTAVIEGFIRTRNSDFRFVKEEDPDLAQVDAELHSFDDGGSGTATVTVRRLPVSSIVQAIVSKEVTRTLTKGVTDSIEALPDSSVFEIVEVVSGATTYVQTTDYTLTGDSIDWSAAGAEPGVGVSYDVTYRYRDAVVEDSFSDTQVTLSGGYTGGDILLTYLYKMPRIDVLCLDVTGVPVYVTGIPAAVSPAKPVVPQNLAPLCTITNSWTAKPTIRNDGTRNFPYTKISRMYDKIVDSYNLIGLERLRRTLDSREPVAKKGVFVDPFENDRYRDTGEAQTAAVFEGSMQLPVLPTFYAPVVTSPLLLDYTSVVHISQPLSTSCRKINSYQNFDPIPAAMTITPSSDMWVETDSVFLSDITQTFGTGNVVRTTQEVQLVDEREELIELLREIDIAFEIEGFGNGEELSSLTFDGLDVTPAGPLAADITGAISGSFTIPASVPAGTKPVVATGAGGSEASNVFIGQGILQIDEMRRINSIFREPTQSGGGGGGGWSGMPAGQAERLLVDPVAQSYAVTEPRMLTSVKVKFCNVGDVTKGCILQIVAATVSSNNSVLPTRTVLSEAFINMGDVVVDEFYDAALNVPLTQYSDRQYCFVLLTDDAAHSISSAVIGDFDAELQSFVSSQPYTVGVMFTSSNALSWNVHNDEDVTFQALVAKFAPLTKTVTLGTYDLVDCSDIMVRANVELPTADARLWFEVVRPTDEVYRLQPNQNLELNEFITETVTLKVVLVGSEEISPILYPGVLFIAGELQTSATYVSRAFAIGTAVRMGVYFKAWLPSGSSAVVDIDKADDTFETVPLDVTEQLNDGWLEREHALDPFTAVQGRLKFTLTGTPAARLSVADLRAASI